MTSQRGSDPGGRFRRMFTDHDAIMLLVDPQSGGIVDANRAACAFYGYGHATLLAMNIADLSTQTGPGLSEMLGHAARHEANAFQAQNQLRDGEVRMVQVHSSPVEDDGRVLLFSIIHDVTEAETAKQALAASEEKFRRLAESIVDIVVVYDERGRRKWVSPSIQRVLGYDPATLIGGNPLDLTHPEDQLKPQQATLAAMAESRTSTEPFRVRMRHADGHYLWVETIGSLRYDDEGNLVEVSVVTRDVDAQVRAENELARMAGTDPMTGMLTRAEVMRRAHEILSHRPRLGAGLGVLFCDLDGMKIVNDSLGHAAGDLLLTTIAERVRSAVRTDDMVARIGGDEFLVLLPGMTGLAAATAVGEAIRRAVAEPIPDPRGGPDLVATVSVGVTLATDDDDGDFDTAIARADQAMYRAKGRGGNQVEVAP